MRISKSVYQLSGGCYGGLGNVYAIRGKKSVALIDCGRAEDEAQILKSLKYWNMDQLPITHVFITHTHFDHAGNAKNFQEKGAKIYCGHSDEKMLIHGGMDLDTVPWAEEFTFTPCTPDVIVYDGDYVKFEDYIINIYGAPGHTDGSILLELNDQEKNILFTGDAVGYNSEIPELAILCWRGVDTYSSVAYRNTLIKMFQNLKPDILLGGHGNPCLSQGWKVLQLAYKKYLLEYQ